MSEKIRIVNDVPMPEREILPPMPLDKMEIGDSFELPLKGINSKNSMRQRLYRYQKNNPPKRFSLQTIDLNSVRIFRVPDYET